MNATLKLSSFNKSALFGLALLLPTLSFFGMVASKYLFGVDFLFTPFQQAMSNPQGREIINFLSPIVFLGGSLLALVVNIWAVAGLNFHTENNNLIGNLIVKGNVWNLTIVLLSFALIAMLLGYLVAENWQCWVGLKENC